MAGRYERGDEIPQMRSYTPQQTRSGGLGRTLAWLVLAGSMGVLFAALAGPGEREAGQQR